MINQIKEEFKTYFKQEPTYYMNTGGRLEILGNHTDHNHGQCLVANCSLRLHAAVRPIPDKVRIKSEGYKFFEFDLNDLKEHEDDSSSCALCRGILFKLKELGFNIGGFEAYIKSEIPKGSGVSSSAAIESLFGYLISHIYNKGKIDPLTIAKVGQFAENNYFHKPSGLLDQIGTSFGGCNFIDFQNIDNPLIKPIQFDLPLDIYLIKSEGHHAGLTDLYAKIPAAMNKVAMLLDKKQYLGDIVFKKNLQNIFDRIDKLKVNEETKNIAKHFFFENTNVVISLVGIKNKDLEIFLSQIEYSQDSSLKNLKNTYIQGEYKGSPQQIIDEVTDYFRREEKMKRMVTGRIFSRHETLGAVRIHGGGFKGTVIAFVKKNISEKFEKHLNAHYKGKYYPVTVSKDAFVCKKY